MEYAVNRKGNAAMTSRIEVLQQRPFTLCMSSGFFGFFAHGGMLEALDAKGLRPARVVGSSAGTLAAGAWASGVPVLELKRVLSALRREDFWDMAPGWGLLRGARFDALLRETFPVTQIEALETPFACSVYDVRRRATVVLERGDLVSAVRASCAFPALFQPVEIDGAHYLDGGILDRPAFDCLAPDEHVLVHHLATRSPWRIGRGPRPAPVRPGALIMDLGQFTRLHPWALERGPAVWDEARERALRWLDAPA